MSILKPSKPRSRNSASRCRRLKLKEAEFSLRGKVFFFVFIFLFLILAARSGETQTSPLVQEEISEREQQIQELERQKEEYQKQILEKQSQARTLENEVFILDTQIKQIQLEIRTLDFAIQKTELEIDQTTKSIDEAVSKIERIRESLAEFIRLVNQSDQESLLEILLKNRDLSDFFGNLENIRVSQEKAQITIAELKQLKIELEERQEELENIKEEQSNLRKIQEFQRQEVGSKKTEVNGLLKVTQGEEKKFQELVKITSQDIQKLKEQIQFLLQQGITLEDAIKFGHLAAIRAGIRPAFLIAVLEVESGIGRNVGRCNRAEDPPEKKWFNIMHPRDHAPFLAIMSQLGMNPETTAVSCPQIINGRRFGWGGAMGPAQFIPSTWLLYVEEVERLIGRNPANPWNIEDAFMAAAVKLARGGATGQTYNAEAGAARAYYSGNSRCSKAACNSYASAVMRKAAEIEKDLPAD